MDAEQQRASSVGGIRGHRRPWALALPWTVFLLGLHEGVTDNGPDYLGDSRPPRILDVRRDLGNIALVKPHANRPDSWKAIGAALADAPGQVAVRTHQPDLPGHAARAALDVAARIDGVPLQRIGQDGHQPRGLRGRQPPRRMALPAPVDHRHGKTAVAQIPHRLEIFFDVLAAPREHAHRPAAVRRRGERLQ